MKKIWATCSTAIISRTETFSWNFIAFSESPQNFVHFEKKAQVCKLNISEVIDSEKYGYLNARKLLFQNTLRESMCSRPLNTAETTTAALLLELSIDPRNIELENISVREFWNVRPLLQNVECRSHVYSASDEKKLCNVFHCHYLKNEKLFLEILVHSGNLHKIRCIFKKKISFIA